MKKSLVLLAAFCSFFVACKKNTDELDIPIGTITATIGTQKISFNVQAKAKILSVTNGYGIQVQGFKKDPSSSSTDIIINIVRPSSITSGTYTENAYDNPLVEAYHFQELIFGAGTGYSSFHSATKPFTVNIVSMSANSVKGTFQGELRGPDGGVGYTIKEVKDGVFYVSF